uniref:Uncharacterized protein n=1 Tax=Amphimedon queenslandica TaxID=400682 RepID=A0A1X7U6D4_AMPQE
TLLSMVMTTQLLSTRLRKRGESNYSAHNY